MLIKNLSGGISARFKMSLIKQSEMLKPASAASIAGVKKLKVGVKFWATGIYFLGIAIFNCGF